MQQKQKHKVSMMCLLASCPVMDRACQSTWMMQSMLTSASTEMQQQYANEIMKQIKSQD